MKHLVLDIETIATPVLSETIAEWKLELSEEFKKAETIETKLQEKIKRASFDFDGCRPICFGACLVTADTESYFSLTSKNSAEIGRFAANILNTHGIRKVVGFNIRNFDLPILQRWIINSGSQLTAPLGRYDIIDLMDLVAGFGKRVSLERSCNAYDIGTSEVDGSMVQGMYEAGDMEAIERYCLEDVRSTVALFRRLSRVHAT